MRLRFARLLNFQQLGLVLVIVLIAAIVAIKAGEQTIRKREMGPDGKYHVYEVTRNRLLNADVLVNYAKDCSFIAIMAVGMTAVIITTGIDLSVGSAYALAGIAGAMVFRYYGPTGAGLDSPYTGMFLGIVVTLGVAMVCGLFNGLAVVTLKVHPFIITLGTMLVFRGAAFVTTKARTIGEFPGPFKAFIRGDLGFLTGMQPVPMIVMIVVAVLGTLYLSYTVAGRHVYAVGGNLETARFSGLRTNRVFVSVYVLLGLCVGISSIVAMGIFGSASSARGQGYELKVIAAAVVGGASLTGGRGTALGAVLGAMLIQLIDQSIITLEIDQNYNNIIIGAAIIIAVVLDRLSREASARRLVAVTRIGSKQESQGSLQGDSQ